MKKVKREEAAVLQQVPAGYKLDFDNASYHRLQENSKHPRVPCVGTNQSMACLGFQLCKHISTQKYFYV